MKKLKIIGIVQRDEYAILILEKAPFFFEWLKKILENEAIDLTTVDYEERISDTDKFVKRKKKLNEYTDKHDELESDDLRIDLFFGKRKIFITIHAKPKKKKQVLERIFDNSNWIKKTK